MWIEGGKCRKIEVVNQWRWRWRWRVVICGCWWLVSSKQTAHILASER